MKQITITDQDTSESFDFYDNSNNTILRQFDGFEYAEVKSVVENVAGQPGAVYVTSSFGRRRMSFQGDLVAGIPGVWAQRRNLLNVIKQRGRMKLFEITTYDDLKLQFEAEIIRFTAPYTHQIHSYLFELVAPDWRFYSQTEYTDSFTAGQTQNVNNGGNEVTHPVFTITGPGNGISILNNDTAESISVDDMSAGEKVVIDTLNRTVTLDGNDAYGIFSGDFFRLEPGNNSLTFQVNSGSDGNTNLDVTYRDAYNGV